MATWATLKILNLIWNPSPYVICSIITISIGKLHCSYSVHPSAVDDFSIFICIVCIYKTNGVTSTCTQNKLHTTYLQIPFLTSVCKNIYNQYNIMIFIVHIHVLMYMYIILIILIILIRLLEGSHI